jgi:hypothetical protein
MTRQMTLDEQPAEVKARDAAIDAVAEKAGDEFRRNVVAVVKSMSGEFIAEDIRLECERQGIKPHDSHAWGSVSLWLIRHGHIERTGAYRQMQAKGSHARESRVYRRC